MSWDRTGPSSMWWDLDIVDLHVSVSTLLTSALGSALSDVDIRGPEPVGCWPPLTGEQREALAALLHRRGGRPPRSPAAGYAWTHGANGPSDASRAPSDKCR